MLQGVDVSTGAGEDFFAMSADSFGGYCWYVFKLGRLLFDGSQRIECCRLFADQFRQALANFFNFAETFSKLHLYSVFAKPGISGKREALRLFNPIRSTLNAIRLYLIMIQLRAGLHSPAFVYGECLNLSVRAPFWLGPFRDDARHG